jgi:hypothetical protein
MALFVDARTRAARERTHQQELAVRTVAGNARDRDEFTTLLAMLGLEDPAPRPVRLCDRLATYVHQVAAAIGVSADASAHEVTGTASAHIALDERCVTRPDDDLTLAWDERLGWYIAVETAPGEPPVVLGYLDGDAVPAPMTVARFVADTTEGGPASRIRRVLPPADHAVLADRMAAVS